ncbi:MAG: hypothetical protein JO171_05140 [Paludibacterium sp.]|uniref:hypothetical protein n=1 Tax=Paludibacterium sp. TaxID=1917523 RepID=UPI0025D07F76|nr:hypothetical protein [Paludibacterium sp.]MBV8046512.1 hypothetical protein [Paludibacterium sp.]MBV8648896.1 hypothetical protein [Paludibacterium sp.]
MRRLQSHLALPVSLGLVLMSPASPPVRAMHLNRPVSHLSVQEPNMPDSDAPPAAAPAVTLICSFHVQSTVKMVSKLRTVWRIKKKLQDNTQQDKSSAAPARQDPIWLGPSIDPY